MTAGLIIAEGLDDLAHGLEVLIEGGPEHRTAVIEILRRELAPVVATGATAALDFDRALEAIQINPLGDLDGDALRSVFGQFVIDCGAWIGAQNAMTLRRVTAQRSGRTGGRQKGFVSNQKLAELQPTYNRLMGALMALSGAVDLPARYGAWIDAYWAGECLSRRVRANLHKNCQPIKTNLIDLGISQPLDNIVARSVVEKFKPLINTLLQR